MQNYNIKSDKYISALNVKLKYETKTINFKNYIFYKRP